MFKLNKEIRAKILKIVRKNKYGTNISKISYELDILRTTAKRHLELLAKEGKVVEYKQGASRVFYPPIPQSVINAYKED